MELLELNNVTFQKDDLGMDLYYGKYAYKLDVCVPCINFVRYTKTIDKFLIKLCMPCPSINYTVHGDDRSHRASTFRDKIIRDGGSEETLKSFILWRTTAQNQKRDLKIVISRNHLTLYFNDSQNIDDIQSVCNLDSKIMIYKYRQRISNYSSDVVYQKNPKFKYRIYMRDAFLTEQEIISFMNDISKYGLSPNPSMKKRFVLKPHRYGIARYFLLRTDFVDFNDASLTTILGLIYPNFINKLCSIEKK